jgi:hypothetical protein
MPRSLPHSPAHCHTLLYVIYCYSCIIIYLLFSSAAHCRTLPHTAAHCRTLRHTAAHCRVLFFVIDLSLYMYYSMPHTAAHCRAARCRVLFFCYLFIIIYMNYSVSHSAAHCRTLSHSAAPCCILLHTAVCYLLLFIDDYLFMIQ